MNPNSRVMDFKTTKIRSLSKPLAFRQSSSTKPSSKTIGNPKVNSVVFKTQKLTTFTDLRPKNPSNSSLLTPSQIHPKSDAKPAANLSSRQVQLKSHPQPKPQIQSQLKSKPQPPQPYQIQSKLKSQLPSEPSSHFVPAAPVRPPVSVNPESKKTYEAPDANQYVLGTRSPFFLNTKVEKRPLSNSIPKTKHPLLGSKNIYSKDDSLNKSSVTSPALIIAKPRPKFSFKLLVSSFFVLILGLIFGTLIFLAFFQ